MAPTPDPDPFDTLLTLEDSLYTTAYAQGTEDGSRAGRIEGRIFGLEKGFEKFAALGELHGRATVWGARFSASKNAAPQLSSEKSEDGEIVAVKAADRESVQEGASKGLPMLKGNERLKKHVQMLHALTDPATFSTLNTEEAVADFDDRFKRAGAKAKIIERIVGELAPSSWPDRESPESGARNVRLSNPQKKKGEDSMEDFVGSKFLS